jgi:hypothetical protein
MYSPRSPAATARVTIGEELSVDSSVKDVLLVRV